jgi:hypothetical protein
MFNDVLRTKSIFFMSKSKIQIFMMEKSDPVPDPHGLICLPGSGSALKPMRIRNNGYRGHGDFCLGKKKKGNAKAGS